MAKILLLNGPNLNLLGKREPDIYGSQDLNAIQNELALRAVNAGHELSSFQSNAEHELVDRIHQASVEAVDFILINPAAFTHTSIAIRDALLGVSIPFIELHLSNVQQREAFRQHSYFSDIAEGVISGFGAHSYNLALDAALTLLQNR